MYVIEPLVKFTKPDSVIIVPIFCRALISINKSLGGYILEYSGKPSINDKLMILLYYKILPRGLNSDPFQFLGYKTLYFYYTC